MLCRRCAQLALTGGALLRAWVLRAAMDDSAGNGVLCAGCGAMLPPEELTERLVLKLSQLARFGLGGGMAPLLRASPQAFEDV